MYSRVDGKWKLARDAMVKVEGRKFSSLYFMQVKLLILKLWYKRLDHISEKRMTVLAKKKFFSRHSENPIEKVFSLYGMEAK